MTDMPIDRTWLGCAILSSMAGESRSWAEDILYKNYTTYEQLPEPCQCEEVRQEYEAFWAWYKQQLKQAVDESFASSDL